MDRLISEWAQHPTEGGVALSVEQIFYCIKDAWKEPTGTATMVDALVCIGIAVVVSVLVLCLWRRQLDKDDSYLTTAYAALNSPSVRTARNAFDRRVALAVREAKQGVRECEGCGFTNVMRATACVRCSASLLSPRDKKMTSAGRPSSSLQQRIRRRREWTRRVNSHGKLVWCHDEEQAGTTVVGLPSYVLQSSREMQAAPAALLIGTSANESSGGGGGGETFEVVVPESEDITETMTKTIAGISIELQDQIRTASVSVIDVLQADAYCIAFSRRAVSKPSRSDSPVTWIATDITTTALLTFPAKLAHFITSMASLVRETVDHENYRLSLSRHDFRQDSMAYIATIPHELTRAAFRVDFLGEQGIDAGGVYREWFLLLNEAIITPEAGIYSCVDIQNQTFYLNPNSREILGEDHLAHFLAAGRLLGRALLDGNVTGFHLSLPLLKIILGQPVGFSDLQYFDPEVYTNLKWLLENDGVDALCLDFSVTEKLPDGSTRTVELVSGGSDVEVTDTNKVAFVDAKLKYLLFESVRDQLFAYLTGVYEVVPAELLAMFDAEELDYVLSGSDAIDVDDWEANTLSSKNLVVHPALNYFWKVVRELSTEERRYLLQFATGSSRVPPGGFRALTSNDGKLGLFNLRGVQGKTTRGYLHSHACFNRLDIPLHGSLKKMREAVRAAISSESIGFTTD